MKTFDWGLLIFAGLMLVLNVVFFLGVHVIADDKWTLIEAAGRGKRPQLGVFRTWLPWVLFAFIAWRVWG